MDVPKDWRIASATPVFKKGKEDDLRKHRLISFTSALGKVMEQIILEQ